MEIIASPVHCFLIYDPHSEFLEPLSFFFLRKQRHSCQQAMSGIAAYQHSSKLELCWLSSLDNPFVIKVARKKKWHLIKGHVVQLAKSFPKSAIFQGS